ncbi:MAG: RNA 2'-phosphotransferase, partial [Bacteroidota bacterium]
LTNDKQRFTFNATKDKIRANQGHSIAVDLEFEAERPPEILYHGTSEKSIKSILQTGLEKRSRQHVHLSADLETATKVGQRHGKVVILKVQAGKMNELGFAFYLSKNGVWLTNEVPVEYLELM